MAISKVVYKESANATPVTWMDATSATASASDITAPKTAMLANGVLTTGTGGGGIVEPDEKDVNFYDYDGTRVYSYTAQEAQALTALPANPSHIGFTAQGWNWTLAEIKAQLTAVGGVVNVGQHYVTSDGKTEIDICLDDSNYLSPWLGIAVNGTVVVDWGDNSATSTMTGTSDSTVKTANHTYSSTGNYTIKITVSSGKFTFRNGGYVGILYIDSNTNYWNNPTYSSMITDIRIGSNAQIGKNAFSQCRNLTKINIPASLFVSSSDNIFARSPKIKFVVIPSGTTSILYNTFLNCAGLERVSIPASVDTFGESAFNSCFNLDNLTFPSGLTTINKSTFYYAQSMRKIVIPSGVTTVPVQYCYYCYKMRYMTIPNTVTTISDNAFCGPYSWEVITIPASVTSIGTQSFNALYGTKEIHFKGSTPPTLAASNSFGNFRPSCIIYVPTGSLSAYTSAQYYPSSATYTYVEE